ncbi:MAG: radical SAM protein [Calditrichaeota bacterium]|nr:MAG: radical SAM protein [Calditrichota bacterium]
MNPKTSKKLQLLSRIPNYHRFYRWAAGSAPYPVNITISLLYSCNSRCNTCNVYEKRVDNLTVEEYHKIFRELGEAPYWFTFSGGEPFLRKDIVDVVKAAYDHCRPGIINIPTNGSLYKVIPGRVKEMIDYCRDSDIIINLSLDDIGEKHNAIRGFPGNWERAMETYRALYALRSAPNFTLGIHTVISNFNVDRFQEIYRELIQLEPDSYITEIAEQRVELGTMDEPITPGYEKYSAAIDFLIEEMHKKKQKGVARVAQAFRLEYYEMVKKYLRQGTQIVPCFAGITSCQIAPDGEVWPCCIRADSMGNLRDYHYDFKTIWNSRSAAKIRKSIKNRECACPLANASYTNLLVSPKSLAKVTTRLI